MALLTMWATTLGVAAPARSAEWIVLCTGYDACAAAGYSHSGYKENASTSWWSQSTGHNCTNYAAYRLVQNGMSSTKPATLSGNASNWGPSFTTQTNSSPAVGSIAWWDTSFSATGHVAYVEQVISASEIVISEDNWGGDFRWRRVTLGGGRWPTGFIHLEDQGSTVATDARAWQVVEPVRLLDTRTGVGAPVRKVLAGQAVTLQVTGRGGVPASGVDKVLINVNATSPTSNGYLTVHANGTTQPGSRSMSFLASSVNTQVVLSRVGADGKVRLYSSATTDLSADVVGWSPTDGFLSGGAPARVLDTRKGLGAPTGKLAAGGTLTLTVTGKAGVPTDAAAAVLNVSSTDASSAGWLTAYPNGVTRPSTPQVRFGTAKPATGLVVARIGSSGAVRIHTTAQTNVLVDVVGWLPTGADQVAVTPKPILNTAKGLGYPAGRVGAGGAVTLNVVGLAGVPSTGVRAVVLTVRATSPTASGYFTAHPSGTPEPAYASAKYPYGRSVTNTVVVPVGSDGKVRIVTSASTYLSADVQGYIRW
ncbi:CHAP domain-containing protein [Intrasporangium sp. DVR]|uniref:CHAP domain-containing protein n=1 Tax=Intrasporangium sp. DVR TaxID=3127867 RepID=UPI00334010D3